MGIRAAVVPSLRLGASDRERLRLFGLTVADADAGDGDDTGDTGDTGTVGSPDSGDVAAAIAHGAARGALLTVADRGADPRRWRQDGGSRLEAATRAAAAAAQAGPLALVLLPAGSPPRPGPVAVLSPAGSASAYELYVAAGLAARSGRRVEHLNGRGAAASAISSGLPGRFAARSAVPDWRERVQPRPERSLHALTSRPAVIVVPVPPCVVDAAPVIAGHPDADIVLLFDIAQARLGAHVAHQVASMIEHAVGVELSLPVAGAPATTPGDERLRPRVVPAAAPSPAGLPSVRASDVVHVRLTDEALELTNRTQQRIRLRVTLGSATAPERVRAVFDAVLAPGEVHAAKTAAVPAFAELASPTAVLRHWSHTSAEVYEGGDRRIFEVETTILDAASVADATSTDKAPNGLDFALTARELGALVGQSARRPVLPEPAPAPPAPGSSRDVFAAFEAALAIGAGVLANGAS